MDTRTALTAAAALALLASACTDPESEDSNLVIQHSELLRLYDFFHNGVYYEIAVFW